MKNLHEIPPFDTSSPITTMNFFNRLTRLSTVANASLTSQLAAMNLLSPRASTRARRAKDEVSGVREYNDLRYPFPVKTASLLVQGQGVDIAFVDEGAHDSENVIVFLHGLGSYIPAWSKNIEVLRGRYRCIALDMPGFGRSSKSPTNRDSEAMYPFSMEFFSEVVVGLLNHLNVHHVTLCGHSMGGQIAMTTALRFAERVSKLMLVNTAGFEKFSERELEWLWNNASAASVRDAADAEIRTSYRLNFFRMPPDAELMIAERLALRSASDFWAYCLAQEAAIKAMVTGQVRDRLESITQPTLVVYGENDALIPNPVLHSGSPRSVAKSGADAIPNCQLVIVPRCGHFSQFEQPEAVNQAIMGFLG